MGIFDNNPFQQQQALSGLVGGFLGLGGVSPNPSQLAIMQQGQQPQIKFKRYGDYGVKRHLTFIEELREEIDNWLHN